MLSICVQAAVVERNVRILAKARFVAAIIKGTKKRDSIRSITHPRRSPLAVFQSKLTVSLDYADFFFDGLLPFFGFVIGTRITRAISGPSACRTEGR